MEARQGSCPLSCGEVIDRYFLEHRAKLIDIAAFLDRLDRAADAQREIGGDADDFRMAAFRAAMDVLTDGRSERVRRILELLSDPTDVVPTHAQGSKGAAGAYGAKGAEH